MHAFWHTQTQSLMAQSYKHSLSTVDFASKMIQMPCQCQEGRTAMDLAKQRGFKACQEPLGNDDVPLCSCVCIYRNMCKLYEKIFIYMYIYIYIYIYICTVYTATDLPTTATTLNPP